MQRVDGGLPGAGGERWGVVGQQLWSFSYAKRLGSGDLLSNIMPRVNKTVLYTETSVESRKINSSLNNRVRRITNIYYVHDGSGTRFIHLILTIPWSKIYYLSSHVLSKETKTKSIAWLDPDCISRKSQSWHLSDFPLLFSQYALYRVCCMTWNTLLLPHLFACLCPCTRQKYPW